MLQAVAVLVVLACRWDATQAQQAAANNSSSGLQPQLQQRHRLTASFNSRHCSGTGSGSVPEQCCATSSSSGVPRPPTHHSSSTGWGAGGNCSSSSSGLSYLRSAVVGGSGLLQGHVAGRGMEVLER
jgi:hypothetical protein